MLSSASNSFESLNRAALRACNLQPSAAAQETEQFLGGGVSPSDTNTFKSKARLHVQRCAYDPVPPATLST